MIKNKEWLKNNLNDIGNAPATGNEDYSEGFYDAFVEIEKIVNQLDEPKITEEQAWRVIAEINNQDEAYWLDAKNSYLNLISESERGELPEVPQFVVDWIRHIKTYKSWLNLYGALRYSKRVQGKVKEWLSKDNSDLFARVWLDVGGYTVKKEETYYAKIKGHELIDINIEADEGDKTDPEWYRNIYFVLQSDGELIIDMKESGLAGAKHSMTKEEWGTLGVNENNADFDEVAEL